MISIIIPIYNCQDYLERCLQSLLKQKYCDYEIILVNDGSKDDSLKICQKYAKKDPRFHVFNQKNQGVSSARNNGIKQATGEYVCFVDGDDFVSELYLENMLKHFDITTDLVIGGYYNYYGKDNFVKSIINDVQIREFDIEHFDELLHYIVENGYLNSPVAKLYKRALLNEIVFPENIRIGEDKNFNIDYLRACKYVKVLNIYDYFYDRTSFTSATKKLDINDYYDSVKIYQNFVNLINELSIKTNIDYLYNDFFVSTDDKILYFCKNKKYSWAKILIDDEYFREAYQYSKPTTLIAKINKFLLNINFNELYIFLVNIRILLKRG